MTIKKFRVWDVQALGECYEQVLQVKENVEAMLKSIKIEDMPPSVVPTSMLYDLAVCYEAMYEKLLEDSLIDTGVNRKITKVIH